MASQCQPKYPLTVANAINARDTRCQPTPNQRTGRHGKSMIPPSSSRLAQKAAHIGQRAPGRPGSPCPRRQAGRSHGHRRLVSPLRSALALVATRPTRALRERRAADRGGRRHQPLAIGCQFAETAGVRWDAREPCVDAWSVALRCLVMRGQEGFRATRKTLQCASAIPHGSAQAHPQGCQGRWCDARWRCHRRTLTPKLPMPLPCMPRSPSSPRSSVGER